MIKDAFIVTWGTLSGGCAAYLLITKLELMGWDFLLHMTVFAVIAGLTWFVLDLWAGRKDV